MTMAEMDLPPTRGRNEYWEGTRTAPMTENTRLPICETFIQSEDSDVRVATKSDDLEYV